MTGSQSSNLNPKSRETGPTALSTPAKRKVALAIFTPDAAAQRPFADRPSADIPPRQSDSSAEARSNSPVPPTSNPVDILDPGKDTDPEEKVPQNLRLSRSGSDTAPVAHSRKKRSNPDTWEQSRRKHAYVHGQEFQSKDDKGAAWCGSEIEFTGSITLF